MTILQLMPQFPFPMTDGGKIGIGNITRQFAEQGHEVHILAVSSTAISQERGAEAEQWAASVHIVEQDIRNSPANIVRSLLSPLPLYVWKFTRNAVIAHLDSLCTRYNFDCIHADHSSMIPLALHAKQKLGIPAGLRIHNVEWLIWQRYAERFAAWHPARIYLQLQADKLRLYESRFYPQFDVCFPITEDDAARARVMARDGNYIVAPAGVNPDEWLPQQGERNPKELVLATTYQWVHNVDGALWLINNVLPLLRKEHDVHLTLLGKDPPESLTSLGRSDITVTGFVESVRPYLSRAGIYVAPLFVGGGIRIKILEAMAMELPVVATPVAAEGIGATQADGLFIAGSAEEFAQIVARLVAQPALARELGAKARAFVTRHYTWKHNVGIMLDAYEHLCKPS